MSAKELSRHDFDNHLRRVLKTDPLPWYVEKHADEFFVFTASGCYVAQSDNRLQAEEVIRWATLLAQEGMGGQVEQAFAI